MKQRLLTILLLLVSSFCFAQKTITGKVTGPDGNPLPGVSVIIKGTTQGTTTDANGDFSISAGENATLVFSIVGYQAQEVSARGTNALSIQLRDAAQRLNEVVVVGYGTLRRKSVTGAVSRVSNEELTALPVPDPRQALQGRVPGVIVTNNGSPGESPIVRIRGIGSINFAADPFYVIDGYPGGDMSMIDSRDIESIDILRDAATAAIYGSRAANGVVFVTTKKGSRTLKPRISVDAYYGWQTAWRTLDLLNTEEYLRYATALKTNANAALPPRFANLDQPVYQGASQTYRQTNTDWQDAVFRTAPITQANISLATGSEKFRLYLSGGYFQQDGIMLGTSYKRYNFRVNSEYNISKVFTFGQSLTVATEDKLNENNSGGRTQLKHIVQNIPYIPVEDPTLQGGYRGPSGDDGSDPQNPVRIALQDISRNNTVKILGVGFIDAKFFEGFSYRFTAGVNYSSFVNRTNLPIYNESFNARTLNRVEQTNSNYRGIYLSNQLTYIKTFGDHSLNAIAVAERQDGRGRSLFAGGSYTTNELQTVSNTVTSPGVSGNLSEDVIISYLGRVNYEYKSRYLLSGSYRKDGSSVWAPGRKWEDFYSVSGGWRISEEAFFPQTTRISELKLRGSYGTLGFNGLPNYSWQAVLRQNAAPILGTGNDRLPTAFINSLPNEDLSWEITKMWNLGLDFGLFNNRLYVQAEYYKRTTDNLIIYTPVSSSLGFTNSSPANLAKMENSGFEFIATYTKVDGNFTWDLSGNIGTLNNKVLSFGPQVVAPFFAGTNADYGGNDITKSEPGDVIQAFYGWKVDGIFQNQAEIDAANKIDGNDSTKYQDKAAPGDIRFKDINGDGVITADDRTILGSFIPDFTYGLNFSARYRNFDLTLYIQGVQGNEIYNGTKVLTQGMLRLFGAGKDVLNAWTPSNTNTNIPRAVDGDPNNNSRTSDRFIEDGSYMRIKILSIGYNIPKNWLSRVAGSAISNFRVYVSAQNLLTITNYTGYDPEVGSRFNATLTNGVDYGQFPQARTFLVGLKVDF